MSPRFLFLAPLLLIPLAQKAPVPAAPAAWKIDAVHSTVLFKVKHLGTSWSFGRFNGIAGELTLDEAKPENCKLHVEIDASSVDTANKDRDDHLRSSEFFSAEEFPKIVFSSTSVTRGSDKYKITGDLALSMGLTKGSLCKVTLASPAEGRSGSLKWILNPKHLMELR